jgi:hypothetical protein
LANPSLGTSASEIVKQATMTAHVGELDGIKLAIQNGKIDDVWIEDLREFNGEILPSMLASLTALYFNGKSKASKETLDANGEA